MRRPAAQAATISAAPLRLCLTRALLATGLVMLSGAGSLHFADANAQEVLATPEPDGTPPETPAEIVATGNVQAASAVTLSLDTETISFGEVVQGGATHMEDAVVVTVSGTSGPWQLLCSAAPSAGHTTNAPISVLEYAPVDTTNWTAFRSDPAICAGDLIGDTSIGFDYQVVIPEEASPGTFDVVVTYTVETLG